MTCPTRKKTRSFVINDFDIVQKIFRFDFSVEIALTLIIK